MTDSVACSTTAARRSLFLGFRVVREIEADAAQGDVRAVGGNGELQEDNLVWPVGKRQDLREDLHPVRTEGLLVARPDLRGNLRRPHLGISPALPIESGQLSKRVDCVTVRIEIATTGVLHERNHRGPVQEVAEALNHHESVIDHVGPPFETIGLEPPVGETTSWPLASLRKRHREIMPRRMLATPAATIVPTTNQRFRAWSISTPEARMPSGEAGNQSSRRLALRQFCD